MTCKKADEVYCKRESENELITFDFSGRLSDSELLSGIALVVEQVTSDLTITDIAINVIELDFDGYIIPIGKAVQCLVADGVVGLEEKVTYELLATVNTDSSPIRKLQGLADLDVSKG